MQSDIAVYCIFKQQHIQSLLIAMARYIVLYRISRYWGSIVAYLYRDNYPSNKVDIPHNSQSPSASMPSMPSATTTKGVSCSVAGAGKVTLIGSNCPASQVGRCVDCEGVRTAQVFSDCAILNISAVRPPAGRGGQYSQKPCWITLDFKEHRLPADGCLAGRTRPRHDRRLARRPVSRHLHRRQCW